MVVASKSWGERAFQDNGCSPPFLFVLQIKLYEIASIFRHPAIMNEFTVSLFNQSAAGGGGME